MSEKIRLLEFDALKGIASLAVVLYHYTTRYDQVFGHEKSPYLGFDYGYLGVSIFFMMSGFLILMSINRTRNIGEYTKKRIIRLYPAYIVAVTITFLSVKSYGLSGREVSLFEGVFNLTMLQGFFPGMIGYVDGAYWTLTVELIFYIFMGFLFYFGLIKRIEGISITWLVGSFLVQILHTVVPDHAIVKGLVYYAIVDYSHLFIAGIFFYLLKDTARLRYYIVVISCLIYQFMFNDLIPSIVVSAFFLLFYAAINGKLQFIALKPFVYLGTISYALYLVHQNIGYIIINVMEKNGLTNEFFIMIPIAISMLLAHVLTFHIEQPVLKHFRNWVKQSENKSAVNTASNIK